jgi:protein-S-isoprenylcysteine O-methyltransferase Ste14
MAINLAIFLGLSAVFIGISIPSFRNPKSHGFFRFFVFELIALMVIINSGYWFEDPTSPAQIASWILLSLSIPPVLFGFGLLKARGKPGRTFEDTTKLVETGIYRHIRHPMYCSLLLLAFGAFLKNITVLSATVCFACAALIYATARAEERENIAKFGKDYEDYMCRTRMFMPGIM